MLNYMYNFFDNMCLGACSPAQILNINTAINDISAIEVYSINGKKYDLECIEISYSLDGINWSCWEKYEDAAIYLFSLNTDYYIRLKIFGPIGKVTYNGIDISWSASLAKCFEFNNNIKNPNAYNPYANVEYAMGLYQKMTESVSDIVGIPIYYIKLKPDVDSKDITFKEYTLFGVESVKQLKMIIQDNVMPSSKPEFSEFGFDFSTDWETEISKTAFSTAFGINAKPMEGDLIYVPMMKRMWMVNGAYDEKNDGFMWNSTTFKIALVKYQDKSSVDLGDTQAFVDTLVKNKYDDLFGNNENRMSNQDIVESPKSAAIGLYPVFESDAVRKYVKHTTYSQEGIIKDINAKLVYSPLYNKGTLLNERMYDFSKVIEESYIIYQNEFIGVDCSVSFLISFGNEYCKGTLLKVGSIYINIDMNPETAKISIQNINEIELQSNKTYFVYARWSKSKDICELCASEYKYPENIDLAKLKKYHMYFDLENKIENIVKYDIELEQCEKNDIILYSFSGKITNIKIFDEYNENISELMQQYPTNQHLIVNDTARKFVDLNGNGVSLR